MKKILLLTMMMCSIILFAQNINPGTGFAKMKKYFSPNQQYYLMFQNDGNLVMYSKSNAPLWASKTENIGDKAEFQNDGNLVIYNRAGAAIFSTGTNGRGAFLSVQNDGNLVVYGNRQNALWASKDNNAGNNGAYNTGDIFKDRSFPKGDKIYSANGDYYLTFQQDGNLVLYYISGSAVWDSKTAGRGYRASFQNDGNLVVYDNRNSPIFSTNTGNKDVEKLVVQNDGNLVIYNRLNGAVWASK